MHRGTRLRPGARSGRSCDSGRPCRECRRARSGQAPGQAVGIGCLLLLLLLAVLPRVLSAHGGIDHVAQDANAAKLAQNYAPFEVDPALVNVPLQTDYDLYGAWGPVIAWPHIPVSAANLADGRVLTWASNQPDDFPVNHEYTHAAVWDPAHNSFLDVPNPGHDMFCAHQVMLEDGRVFVNGGRNHTTRTSLFDSLTNTWTVLEPMSNGRWYPTTIALTDGTVLTALGGSGGRYPELWESGLGWRQLTGIDFTSPILSFTSHFEQDWWPFLTVRPDGDLLHYGPTPNMHKLSTAGTGSISPQGVLTTAWYPKNSAHVVYDEGRILLSGGAVSGSNRSSTDKALLIDFNGPAPVVTPIAPMAHPRKFHNAVVLPNGEVLVVGGNTSGIQFNDTGTILTPEIWSPVTQGWRAVADISVPRNYHSVALLLVDGRVLSAGGGLCGGCPADHQNAQVYSPPYLFNADGTPAPRPVLAGVPAAINNGQVFDVTATPGIQRFTMIKLSSTTHANNTDQRFLNVAFTEPVSGQYQLTAHGNENVLTPGYYFLFALNAQGTPSIAEIVQVNAGASPANYPTMLVPLPNQFHAIGDPVNVAISALDIDGRPLTYSATGLPPGIVLDSVSGVFSGSPSAVGSYTVNVTVADSLGAPVGMSFSWFTSLAGDGMGSILREWWLNVGGSHVDSLLTTVPNYPNSPDGSELVTLLEGPTDWDNRYGQRLRGYIHPPISGDYVFWIASDDESQLFLSTGTDPANAAMIATATPRTQRYEWNLFPAQQSAPIPLQQGQAYYIEVLHKEAAASLPDHVAVAWQIPGTAGQAVITGSYLTPWGYDPHNRSPSVTGPGMQTGVLADSISLTLAASDPDGDALVFSASGLPGGLSISASSGLITGTLSQTGSFSVTVTVDDGRGRTGTASFDWLVSAVPANNPPVIQNPFDQVSHAGDSVQLSIVAIDPEGDTLTYTATGLPDGLAIDPLTGVITGVPLLSAVYTPVVTVADGHGNATNKGFLWTVHPQPLGVAPLVAPPVEVNVAAVYTAVAQGGQNPLYKWNFGDGTPETVYATTPAISHVYTGPGRFIVTLTVTGSGGTTVQTSFVQTVHPVLTAGRPAVSMSILYEDRAGNDRVWAVNPDNDSVSVFDTVTHARLAETGVDANPRSLALAPDGRVWVVNKQSATLSIINPDTFSVEATVLLPAASQPHGLVFAPSGLHAYVALEAGGSVLRLDAADGSITGSVAVGPHVRHLSVTADGARLFATRFITPPVAGEATAAPQIDATQPAGGEVLVIDTASLTAGSPVILHHSDLPDAANAGRGLPNYLGPAVISPDGASAWVPSKQDNIRRGVLRDGNPLTHDSTVRSITSRIDLQIAQEDQAARIDHDDGGVASSAAFDPFGTYLYVALEGSRQVSMRNVFNGIEVVRFDTGRAPQGLVLAPDGLTLYVHNFMDRSISVHDLSGVLAAPGDPVPLLNTWDAVSNEQLSPAVLTGKQLFYDARDTRLALQGYISCAACHNDGGHDGRVWDFTGFGEGLRNTIDLRGHAGTAQGPLHWSGNFDEVQDFEGQIRNLGLGGGLMNNTDFLAGTHALPLGDPKAGLSADLDALAAYVASLNTHPRSPFRNPDGSRSAAATSGQSLFLASGCGGCHAGVQFTDSALNRLHDIGTLTPASGSRLGGALPGLDTPTLRGVWAGAPYLHDGSAPTLAAAIQAHGGVQPGPAQLDMLVSYLEQLDDLEPEPLDSDGDGLADTLEALLGTDPLLADSDGDSLSDYYEVNIDGDPGSYRSGTDYDPLLADTDADGFADAIDPLPLVFHYADGDVAPLGAPDGNINAGDVLIYLRMISGDVVPSTLEYAHGDIYPPGAPDGRIDLSDYLILQRMVMP